MKYQKTVKVGGLTWSVISRNERSSTHEGRHFFAARCHLTAEWRLTEDDQNIAEAETSRALKVWLNTYKTADLSRVVKDICGNGPGAEPHPFVTFAEWRAQMQARRA